MPNSWAITIGINQYRHLQPLMHAQNDALFTHRFLTEEAGFRADHCVLLSDLATSVEHQVVYPDKLALLEWLQTITQQVNQGDRVIFFFSGYGAQADGTDYLMPIDGDPGQIENTGIAAADLMAELSNLPTDKTLLLLDINRSQGSLSGQAIGQQVIDLAEKYEVATLLSCQPEQYSHETFGTRHGLFTAALLEAWRQNCTTIGEISDYLIQRLPELCEHHWRPIQNPVSLIPAPLETVTILVEDAIAPDLEAFPPLALEIPAALKNPETSEPIESPYVNEYEDNLGSDDLDSGDLTLKPPSLQPSYREDKEAYGEEVDRNTGNAIVPYRKPVNGAQMRNWGLLALAVLVLGVLIKQPFIQVAWKDLSEKISGVASRATGDGTGEGTADEATGTGSKDQLTSEAGAEAAKVTPTAEDAAPTSTDSVSDSAAVPTTNNNGANTAAETDSNAGLEADQTTAKALIAKASAALTNRQYSEALIALQRVPQSQRDNTFSSILTKARAGAAEAQQANASVLTEARTAIQPIQATQFTEAIAKARRIQPGEPYYEAAQSDIRSWSQVILDIAEGRATSGNLEGAIAAATIMPYDNKELYQKAKDRIAFWQQRQNSRQIIVEAQAIPKSGQASSYQEGIVRLREIPIEHPEYEKAQRLADDWSERIFSIAQARAAQGRQPAAIQAAILVPAGTTAYEPAQQAIRRWQAP
ncbi:MAG: hypothetical protein DCF15_10140 [Phormidesmis priestleyi]|uniref:Peptidase C14 caspase domain-containing protein n=1 Tax=Phormidesmis priestleyi TaxID=268141 RepID=A0A2W4ZBN0_9CYAN|nr:MAG: hypothetical protein DCF15_10140 [Phormidesmis priestleyi]